MSQNLQMIITLVAPKREFLNHLLTTINKQLSDGYDTGKGVGKIGEFSFSVEPMPSNPKDVFCDNVWAKARRWLYANYYANVNTFAEEDEDGSYGVYLMDELDLAKIVLEECQDLRVQCQGADTTNVLNFLDVKLQASGPWALNEKAKADAEREEENKLMKEAKDWGTSGSTLPIQQPAPEIEDEDE